MNCNDVLNKLSLYYDGELDEACARKIEEHLMACSSCKQELDLIKASSEAFSIYNLSPDLEFQKKLRSGLEAAKSERKQKLFKKYMVNLSTYSTVAACILLLIVVSLSTGKTNLFGNLHKPHKQAAPLNTTDTTLEQYTKKITPLPSDADTIIGEAAPKPTLNPTPRKTIEPTKPSASASTQVTTPPVQTQIPDTTIAPEPQITIADTNGNEEQNDINILSDNTSDIIDNAQRIDHPPTASPSPTFTASEEIAGKGGGSGGGSSVSAPPESSVVLGAVPESGVSYQKQTTRFKASSKQDLDKASKILKDYGILVTKADNSVIFEVETFIFQEVIDKLFSLEYLEYIEDNYEDKTAEYNEVTQRLQESGLDTETRVSLKQRLSELERLKTVVFIEIVVQ